LKIWKCQFFGRKKEDILEIVDIKSKTVTDLGENLIRGIKLVTTSRVISQHARKIYSIS